MDIKTAGEKRLIQRLLVCQRHAVGRGRQQRRTAATDKKQQMIVRRQAGSKPHHRLACRQAARVRYRMRTGETRHARNLGMAFIGCDDDARRIAAAITNGRRHSGGGLAHGNHGGRVGLQLLHRRRRHPGGMPRGKGCIKCAAGKRPPICRRCHPTLSGSASSMAKARAFSTTFMPMATRVSSVADPR